MKAIFFIILFTTFLLTNSQENTDINIIDSNSKNAIEITDFSCNYNYECENGICLKNKCSCNYGIITVKFNNNTSLSELKPCNYSLKKQSTAFFFELLLGFGIGHFYAERTTHGVLKFFAYILVFLFIVYYPILVKKMHDADKIALLNLSVILLFSMVILLFVLYVYDLAKFGSNSFKDGYGFEMIPWN